MVSALLGLCIGAVLGGVAFAVMPTNSTATAFLQLQNPKDLTAIAGGADQLTPDNQGNIATFVAGEIAYLSGDGFAQAVARKMADDKPVALNVAQANESAMVTISYTGGSDSEAIRTVQAAIDLYTDELKQRVDRQLRTILPAVTEWQQRGTDDSNRMRDLLRLREGVELQAAADQTLLVVQPPTANHPSGHRWVMGAILGALVGGAGAIALVLWRRRRTGRGAVVDTLTERVDGVLVPAVGLDLPDDVGDDQMRIARTLYTQLRSTDAERVVYVVGASPASGATAVARLLDAAASAEHPGARIVDRGAVGDPAPADAAATDVVLVARIDTDTVAQVLALRAVTEGGDVPTLGAFTYRRRRWGRRSR